MLLVGLQHQAGIEKSPISGGYVQEEEHLECNLTSIERLQLLISVPSIPEQTHRKGTPFAGQRQRCIVKMKTKVVIVESFP